ncbi:PRC and DUF2382 domain-containing protein [Actinophytocola gossypii]|uniref:PRC and DUF2382 domain-containing protein n=1 Tax=Actinophytocola gossypii TaxID=2812003 RepID=A0ABT2JIP9_9PSEU|nr:PRC and DUF2382 domain-containing protein [Actinophytocola gossypii]MCT2587656.1 PRC and DUF2382 domain-containing protein [Actinophytocola gossypii]
MIGQDMVNRLYDCQVVDPGGERIGPVKRIWLDGRTGDPVWASVHTGMFGLKETFVPLQRAELHEDQLQVPVDKAQVKDAPRIDAEGDQMSDEEQRTLYRYYGMGASDGDGRHRTDDRRGMGQQPGSVQRSPSGQRDDGRWDADDTRDGESMTRAEERLRVGTEQVEAGRVRLVKHVVTDEQQVSVPVSHEEVRVEREPVTDPRGTDTNISEDEQEVRLHAEKPVVGKETVPMERVRLTKDTVTGEETVSDEVRREEIDVEDDRDAGRRPPTK